MNAQVLQVGRPRKYTEGYALSSKQLYILEAMFCYFIITWQIVKYFAIREMLPRERIAVSKIVHILRHTWTTNLRDLCVALSLHQKCYKYMNMSQGMLLQRGVH